MDAVKVGVVLDNKVNRWALQRFEPLKDAMDVTVFVGERNDYDVSGIDLKKCFLTHGEEVSLALKDPVRAYRRVLWSPFKKMDFYYFSLRKLLGGFDVLYSCDVTRSAFTLASLKDELGFRFVLSWWENIPHRAVFDRKTEFQKRLVMEKVDLFLPFTETAKRTLLLEGVAEQRVKVLYPGVDLERFRPGEKPRALMEAHGISGDAFIILYAGKLASWKGVHNLVYAAMILKKRGLDNFVVLIAGRGAQRENMERLIGRTDLSAHFRFLDFVSYDEIPDLYRLADIFVLPSYPTMGWQEQFGMVLVEAMGCGVPVISTKSGSIPEVVGDGGILVPAGDFFGLARAMESLMKDPGMRKALAQRGRERAERLFDNRRGAKALERVFENVCRTSGGR